jgi:Fur family transcriptional regulator, peroxide stress response regulator
MMDTLEILKSHDVKPTVVRMKVYEYLITERNHPTADTIYKSLISEIPTLSKTSVYNTMELLQSRNLVQAITIEENETRFDADVSHHGHFKCTSCGAVHDFHVDLSDAGHGLPAGFTVHERHVYYKGVCDECG